MHKKRIEKYRKRRGKSKPIKFNCMIILILCSVTLVIPVNHIIIGEGTQSNQTMDVEAGTIAQVSDPITIKDSKDTSYLSRQDLKVSKEEDLADQYFIPDTKLAIPIEPGTINVGGSEMVFDSFGNIYILYGYDYCNFEVWMSSDKGNSWHRYGTLEESVRIGSPSMAVDVSQSKQTWWWNAEGDGFEEIYVNEVYVAYHHEYASDDHDIKLWQVNPSSTLDVDVDGEDEENPSLSIQNGIMVVAYEHDVTQTRIKVAKSTDHGETFSLWKTIGEGAFVDKQGPVAAIDRKGICYVAYAAENFFTFKMKVKIAWDPLSSDAESFSNIKGLSSWGDIDENKITLGVSQSSSAATRIAVGYINDPFNPSKYYHQVFSEDDGETWSEPTVIAHKGSDKGIGPITSSIYNPQIVVEGINTQLDMLGDFYYIFETNGFIQCLTEPHYLLGDTETPRDITDTQVVTTPIGDFSSATTHIVNNEWVPAFCYHGEYGTGGIYYASVIPPAPVPPDPPYLHSPKYHSCYNPDLYPFSFMWQIDHVAYDTEHFRIQVIQMDDPSTPVIDTEVFFDDFQIYYTYEPSSPLPIQEDSFQTFYGWRVQEKNQYGWSDWTEYEYFYIDKTPPSRPNLVYPSDIILNYNSGITFNWTTWLRENKYNLYIKDSDGTTLFNETLILHDNQWPCSYTPDIVLPNDLIFWQVRGIDAAGNVGNWSSTASFRVDTGRNYGPGIYRPKRDEVIWTNPPTLEWTVVENATSYWVEISDDPLLENLIDWNLNQPTTQYTTINLTEDQTYWWRVRANYPDLTHGPWSHVYNFTINESAKFPLSPDLDYPYSGKTYNLTQLQDIYHLIALNWTSVSGATEYEFCLDTVYPFSYHPERHTIHGYTDEIFSPDPIFVAGDLHYDSQTYYWSVRARNASTIFGDWSPVYSFTVDTTPPDPPEFVNPRYQDSYHSSYIPFNWTYGLNAEELDYYHFQLATDQNFTSILYGETTGNNYTSYAVPSSGTYYARVRAHEYMGDYGAWSGTIEFSVDLTILPPNLKTPLNNTQLHEAGFYLEWYSINRSKPSYHIQVSTNSDFSALTVNTTTSDLCTYVSVPDGNYFWKIRAKAGTLPYGYWSEVWRFYKNASTTTNIIYPVEGATLGTPTVRIAWDPLYGALSYEVELATTPDFSSIVLNPTKNTTQLYLRNVADHTYYLRVRARYSKVDYSPWSLNRTFTVHTTDSPWQLQPSNGELTNDSRPYFEWQPIKGATNYQLVVSGDSNFVKSIMNTTVSTYHFKFRDNLSDGTYYWKIKCNHSTGIYGDWSPTWSFELLGVFSEIPELLEPPRYANISDLTPTLDWNISIQTKYMQFHVQVAPTFEFKELVVNATTTELSYSITTMLDTGIYYWRVRATDGIKPWGFWSYISFFNVSNAGAFTGKPLVLYPSNTSIFTDIDSIEIEWTPLKGASIYELEISTFENFAKKLVTLETFETSYTFACNHDTYYFRVRARDRYHEYGTWSDVCMFVVMEKSVSSSSTATSESSSGSESSRTKTSPIPLISSLLGLFLTVTILNKKKVK